MNNLPTPVIDNKGSDSAIPATLEQLKALGFTDAEIAAGEKRGQMEHRGPWQIISKYRAIVMHSTWDGEIRRRTGSQFWPTRSLGNIRESGHELEGRVSLGGRKMRGFTSTQLFELPDGRLVDCAVIFACIND